MNENLPLNNNKTNRKRISDSTQILKGKRKRNETPPPSRRPWGPPNTPPPLSQNMINPPDISNNNTVEMDRNKAIKII